MSLEERWAKIEGFPNYLVSNLGKVMNHKTGRILKYSVDRNGYSHVRLCSLGVCHLKYIHRLVASAFIGKLPVGLQTNHIDGVKLNNKANNLEFITHSENIKHAIKMGLKKPALTAGRKPRLVINLNTKERFPSVTDAARSIGVSRPYLSSYLKRGSLIKGLHFEYID